jgi:hypothetical protein
VELLRSTFGGNVTAVNSSGSDSVGVANGTISGNLSLTNAAVAVVVVETVGGTTTIQSPTLDSNTVVLEVDTFNKGVSITGATVANIFVLGDIFNGNTNLVGGNGNDSVTLGFVTINGNVNVATGTGNDPVFLFGATINGNANFNLGNGNDSLTLDNATIISGNLTIQDGNGNDSITTSAAVFGNLTVQLGNGNDTIAVNSTAAPGGLFTLNAGNGNSSISLTPGAATAFNIAFRFGTGTDTLTLGATASTISGSLLSQNPGGNDFDNAAGWTILPPWTSNF